MPSVNIFIKNICEQATDVRKLVDQGINVGLWINYLQTIIVYDSTL